jgi:hypothetical protein
MMEKKDERHAQLQNELGSLNAMLEEAERRAQFLSKIG